METQTTIVLVRASVPTPGRCMFFDRSYQADNALSRLIRRTGDQGEEQNASRSNKQEGVLRLRRRVVRYVEKKEGKVDCIYGGIKSLYIVARPDPVRTTMKRPSLEQVVQTKRRGRPPSKATTNEKLLKRKRDTKEPDVTPKQAKVRKTTTDKPPPFALVKKNYYVHRPPRHWTPDDVPICNCTLRSEDTQGCNDNCLNRVMFIECHAKYCPCGEKCANRRFQLRQHAPLERFRTELKGWGLQAKAPIRQGDFVIEYVGEVIDTATCQQRLHEYQNAGIENYYFLTLDGSECIDASLKGNLARFINHSCNPNCTTQKWWVDGEIRVGIFAEQDIKPGEEITFDYQFERFGGKKQRCHCGEDSCRGFLGAKPKKKVPQPRKREKKLRAMRMTRRVADADKNPLTISSIAAYLEDFQLSNRAPAGTPEHPPVFLKRNALKVHEAMVKSLGELLPKLPAQEQPRETSTEKL